MKSYKAKKCGLFLGSFAFLSLLVCPAIQAQLLDTVVFGDATSELAHGFSSTSSQVSPGAFSQSGRVLLPLNPQSIYGGDMTFTMKVDPLAQNYFSIKVWGSDTAGGSDNLILDTSGYETYTRDGGQIGFAGGPEVLGKFTYRTLALPLWLTRGQTSVVLRLRSAGRLSPYQRGQYDLYQRMMMAPTRVFYRGYTHTNPYFTPAAEDLQAPAPATLAAHPAMNYPQVIASQKASYSADMLAKLNSTATLGQSDIDELAYGYTASWTSIYQNPAVITRILKDFDTAVTTFYGDGQQANSGWGGSFYQDGDAISLTYAALAPHLDDMVNYGTGGTLARRKAWSAALRADVDQSRFARKTIANQAFTVDYGLYLSNKAIELIDPGNALPEAQAQDYLMQTCGLEYYKGSDLPGGGSAYEDGPNYYMVTPKGNSRERGWVGSDYGLYPTVMTARFSVATGNKVFLNRALVILKARAHFEYPSTDESLGSGAGYYSMVVSDEINTRNNYYPGRTYYTDLVTAALTLDPQAVGYVQQSIADNEFLNGVGNPNVVDLVNYYAAIAAQPVSTSKLPLTDGQPDSAWADEDDQVVAVKHGDERLFVNMFYQSSAIDGEVRVYLTGGQSEHHGDVRVDDVVYADSGTWLTGIPDVDANGGASEDLPPDNPTSANYGVHFPNSTAYGGPGRAAAYTFRFGSYLVGMNSSDDPNYVYTVKLPPGFTGGYDLISGQTLTAPITLTAKTSVVFYYTDPVGAPSPLPSRPVFFTVVGGNAQVALGWDSPSNAATFNVKRATVSGGPYTTVATGLTDALYSDTAVADGTTYYYVVTGVNSTGEGAISGERSATAINSQQAYPWGYATVSTNAAHTGTARITAPNAVTVTTTSYGFNNDAFQRADDFSYFYQTLTGDGSLTARLTSITPGNSNECGIDFRGTLAANDVSASLGFYGNGTLSLGGRPTISAVPGMTTLLQTLAVPYWLRLVRSGMTFTAYGSTDGNGWTTLGETVVPAMSNSTYIGLGAGRSATCVFDNISAIQLLSSTSNTTAIGVSAKPQPTYVGDTINLVASVSHTGQMPLTGLVTFYDGTSVIGTATPASDGEASLPTNSLTAGIHSITATYTGDQVLSSSTSAAINVQVLAPLNPQLLLTSSSNPSMRGANVAFTLTSSATQYQVGGSVSYYDGTTLLSSGNLTNGSNVATFTTNQLAVGTHPITAFFDSGSVYASVTTPALSQIVMGTASVSLTATPAKTTAGTAVVLSSKVTANSGVTTIPTGTVTFMDGATVLSVQPLSGQTASLSINTLAAGTHQITAVYSGDTYFTTATSATVNVVITGSQTAQTINFTAPTTIGYSSAPIPLIATASSGLPVSLTVLSGPGILQGNQLTLTGVGTVVITANQPGNGTYSAAPQVTQSIVVNKGTQSISFPSLATPVSYAAGTSVTLAATATSGLTISYAVSGPATLQGSVLTYTGGGTVKITASQAGNANYLAATTLSQTIQVSATTAAVALTNLNQTYSGSPEAVTVATTPAGLATTVTYNGSATVPSAAGTYAVVATITDSNYSGSATATLIIAPASSQLTFSIPNHIYGDAPFSVSAVSSTPGASVIYTVLSGPASINGSLITITGAGQVVMLAAEAASGNYGKATQNTTFVISPAALTVKANNASRTYGVANPTFAGSILGAVYGDVFTESFSTTATLSSDVDAYPITPTAAGSNLGNYTVTTVNATLTVSKAPTTITLSVSSSAINPNQTVTLSAVVTSRTTGTPTNTVTFYDNGNPLQTVPLSSGSASLTPVLTAGSSHLFTASYAGDTDFSPSFTTAASPVTVASLDFSFTTTGAATSTISPGSSAVFNFSLAPVNGALPGTVTFSTAGLPAGATATFNPASVAPNAGTTAVQMTIKTTSYIVRSDAPSELHGAMKTLWWALSLLAFPLRKRTRRRSVFRAITLMAVITTGIAVITGCGSNIIYRNQDAAPQSYNVTVTSSSGSLQHTQSVTLNLQ